MYDVLYITLLLFRVWLFVVCCLSRVVLYVMYMLVCRCLWGLMCSMCCSLRVMLRIICCGVIDVCCVYACGVCYLPYSVYIVGYTCRVVLCRYTMLRHCSAFVVCGCNVECLLCVPLCILDVAYVR